MSATASAPTSLVELEVSGMTCTACSARVETVLNRLEGVEASVNFATEKATVRFAPGRASVDRLIEAVRDSGYDARIAAEGAVRDHAAEHRAALRDVAVAALFTAPLLLEMGAMFSGQHGWLPSWLQWLLATPVQFWSGLRFYRGAWKSLASGAANMDVLVALGTSAAYFYSASVFAFGLEGHIYFEASATVITLILLGKYLEARAKAKAAQALESLISLQPASAWIERDGRLVEVAVETLGPGDAFVVRPGDRIALDARVTAGESAIDESMLTGEAMPVDKRAGKRMFAGTVNGGGRLHCEAVGVGRDTVLAGIIRLVAAAQASKPPVQKLVDQVSAVFVPIVVVIAVVTLSGWWWASGSFDTALVPAVAVLVIACPCALGLATPTALIVGVGRAARSGILIRNAQALEAAEKLGVLIFDKTGTLTRGAPEVAGVHPASGLDEAAVLEVAVSLEHGSEHPLARAILEAGAARGVAARAIEAFQSHGGRGVSARLAGEAALLGSAAHLREAGIEVDAAVLASLAEGGNSVVGVARAGRFLGWIALSDTLRASTPAALERLVAMGIEPVIVSGDHEKAVGAIAARLGVSRWRAGVLPEGKSTVIDELRGELQASRGASRRRVGMAGDGVNDAPALARADVSFALAGGTGVAIETADVTLMKNDLAGIADAIELSRATLAKIRQNLFFAFVYNVLGIPLAAAGLLNPVIAGAAMAMSSVSVVSNSLLLNRWRAGSGAAGPGAPSGSV